MIKCGDICLIDDPTIDAEYQLTYCKVIGLCMIFNRQSWYRVVLFDESTAKICGSALKKVAENAGRETTVSWDHVPYFTPEALK